MDPFLVKESREELIAERDRELSRREDSESTEDTTLRQMLGETLLPEKTLNKMTLWNILGIGLLCIVINVAVWGWVAIMFLGD